MTANRKDGESNWIDPDDAPEWSDDVFERAALGHWPLPSPLHALARHASQPVDFFWCL